MGLSERERGEEQQTFLPQARHDLDALPARRKPPRTALWYLRLGLEISMAMTIVVLLVRPLSGSIWRDTGDKKPLEAAVPTFPRKTYTFLENKRYLDEDMFSSHEAAIHTLHNWIELSAAGRGYMSFPDYKKYDLGEPYITKVNMTNDGPVYMMTVFHQLHCLSYLVEHFQVGFSGTKLTQEVAHHAAHCFDYIRQGIMCAGDTSLEGKTAAGPGWGSKHECVDYDALLKWANIHGVEGWRGNLPEEVIL